MASFEESFSRAFNTSLTSTQQQMPRLLKMQQDMRDKMDEKQRHDAALNTFNGMIANLDGVTAEGSAKQVVGVQDGQKILDVYQNIIELPDELRRDKQTIAKTFRSETGFDPSEVFLTNVTKRDPIDLQVELDIFREDTVNGRVTAGQIRKIIKDPGTSARLIASTKGRQPGRINSQQQMDALYTIDKAEQYLAGLNAIESKLTQHPDFEIMKPRLEAIRERVMGQIELADESFKRDMDMQKLALQQQRLDPDSVAKLASTRETASIEARAANSSLIANTEQAKTEAVEQGRLNVRQDFLERGGAPASTAAREAVLGAAPAPAFETEADKVLGKAFGERVNELRARATTANQITQDLTTLETLNAQAPIEPGPFEGTRLFMSKVADLLGIPLDAAEPFLGQPSISTAFAAGAKQLALSFRAQGGQRTTNLLLQTFMESLPQLSNTREGNQLIIDLLKRKQEIDISVAGFADEFLAKRGTSREAQNEFNSALNDFISRPENQVVTPEIEARILSTAQRGDETGALVKRLQSLTVGSLSDEELARQIEEHRKQQQAE